MEIQNIDKDILYSYLILNFTDLKKTQFKGKLAMGGYMVDINDTRVEDVSDIDYSVLNDNIYVSIYSNNIHCDYVYHIKYNDYMSYQIVYQREMKLKQLGI